MIKRREFITKTAIGATTAAAATTIGAPNVIAKAKVQWKMTSTWSPGSPLYQTGLDRFAQRVKEMSDGQFDIQVFAGGQLVPALKAFDVVSKGVVQAGAGVAYYWKNKTPAAQWFGAVPFGLNAQGMNAWFYSGGGLKLWEETYAPFNVIPRAYGNTGVQMGGWFNKEIKSIDDYKGLKVRIPGLGGEVVKRVGAKTVLLPGSQIYLALKKGLVDAAEFVGPMQDKRLKLYEAAKYYYTPGWHEPGTVAEVFFNKQAYEKLPKSFQTILDVAAAETNVWMIAEFDAQNGAVLQELIQKHNIQVRSFPEKVLSTLQEKAFEIREEISNSDPQARKVHLAFNKFQDQVGLWGSVSEKSYFNRIAKKYQFQGMVS